MNGVKEIREAEFAEEVLNSNLPVMVDFFATWCGPCQALAPVLEGVAKTYDGRLRVVKVNVDEAPELASTYRIRGVPSLVFFRGGAVVDIVVGLPAPGLLRQKMDTVAASPARVGVCGCCA